MARLARDLSNTDVLSGVETKPKAAAAPVIVITMQRVADTKNCVRYEAADDTIIKSASYLKTDALAVFGDVIPDVLEVTFKAVRAK